jgi:hypothetical protein
VSLLLPRHVFPCSATQPLPEPNQSSGHRPPLRFAASLGHQSKSTSHTTTPRCTPSTSLCPLPAVGVPSQQEVRAPPPEAEHHRPAVSLARRPWSQAGATPCFASSNHSQPDRLLSSPCQLEERRRSCRCCHLVASDPDRPPPSIFPTDAWRHHKNHDIKLELRCVARRPHPDRLHHFPNSLLSLPATCRRTPLPVSSSSARTCLCFSVRPSCFPFMPTHLQTLARGSRCWPLVSPGYCRPPDQAVNTKRSAMSSRPRAFAFHPRRRRRPAAGEAPPWVPKRLPSSAALTKSGQQLSVQKYNHLLPAGQHTPSYRPFLFLSRSPVKDPPRIFIDFV